MTIIYDGDAAGIKASLRGIDLVLEEGLNVRVVLFRMAKIRILFPNPVRLRNYQIILPNTKQTLSILKPVYS